MKRRILLLMMTALLSVGAWATTENVWTGEVTPGWYQGAEDPGECNHFGVVGFTAERKLMKGDYIVVTATTSNQWYNEIKVCKVKDGGNWAGDALTTITNYDFSSNDSKLIIPVSDDIVSALNSETVPQYTLYFDGYNYTMTSVDVVYNRGKANLYYNASGKSLDYYGGQLLAPNLFTAASVGDIVTIDVTSATGWGNVSIYNKCPNSVWEDPNMVDPEGLEKLFTLSVDPSATPTTVSFELTADLLANAIVNGLSLGDGKYTFTSVDLLYTPTVSINAEAGYATLGYAAALDLTDIEAYTAAVSGDKVVLTSVKGKKIPAGTGIILEGSGDVTIPLTTEATETITGNELLISDGMVTSRDDIYALANKSKGVGFYLVEDGVTIPAGKVYLNNPAGVKEFLGFDFGVETAISAIANGQYNLAGQRVQTPTRGIYIQNGKKVIIK